MTTAEEKFAHIKTLFESHHMMYDEYVESNIDSFYNMYVNDVVDTSLSPRHIEIYYAFFTPFLI